MDKEDFKLIISMLLCLCLVLIAIYTPRLVARAAQAEIQKARQQVVASLGQ